MLDGRVSPPSVRSSSIDTLVGRFRLHRDNYRPTVADAESWANIGPSCRPNIGRALLVRPNIQSTNYAIALRQPEQSVRYTRPRFTLANLRFFVPSIICRLFLLDLPFRKLEGCLIWITFRELKNTLKGAKSSVFFTRLYGYRQQEQELAFWCPLCTNNPKIAHHLFISYDYTKRVWNTVAAWAQHNSISPAQWNAYVSVLNWWMAAQ